MKRGSSFWEYLNSLNGEQHKLCSTHYLQFNKEHSAHLSEWKHQGLFDIRAKVKSINFFLTCEIWETGKVILKAMIIQPGLSFVHIWVSC